MEYIVKALEAVNAIDEKLVPTEPIMLLRIPSKPMRNMQLRVRLQPGASREKILQALSKTGKLKKAKQPNGQNILVAGKGKESVFFKIAEEETELGVKEILTAIAPLRMHGQDKKTTRKEEMLNAISEKYEILRFEKDAQGNEQYFFG